MGDMDNRQMSVGGTTAVENRPCDHCGRHLTGRKERFCSDRCRMRDRRNRDQARIDELLQRLEDGLDALREELTRAREP
jgi:hypothetical protein